MNEQWKDGGDCNKCRRQKYCNKPCKQSRIHFLEAMFAKYMEEHKDDIDEDEERNNG